MAKTSKKTVAKKDALSQMKMLGQDLKNGIIKNVYLFYGEEAYLIAQCRDNVKAKVVAEGDTMNCAQYSGENIDEKTIMNLADTMPFFSDRRLIIIEDSGFFTSSHEELASYIGKMPETTCLVFVEKKADSRMKMYKAVAARGAVYEISLPREQDLVIWLAHLIKQAGKNIERSSLEHFIEISAQDMTSMKNELEKLLMYIGDRTVITREDIDQICSVNAENKVFEMIDAIAQKNAPRAFMLYDDLVTLREPSMRILFNINSQFMRLFQIKELMDRGYQYRDISSMTGIRDFIVRKSMDLCRQFDLSELRQAVEDGTELETKVKTGLIKDNIAVEMMISKYSHV